MGKKQLVISIAALGILGACGTYGGQERDQVATSATAANATATNATEWVSTGYTAYFGFDSAEVENEADAAIASAILAAKEGRTLEVLLSGHTDQAGSADYNMKLAQRRVDAVAAKFRAAGIAPGVIRTAVHGEDQPKVAAPDNGLVAENRRVDIAFVKQVEAAKAPRRKGTAPISFDFASWLF